MRTFSADIVAHEADRALLVLILKASLMPCDCVSAWNCQVSGFYFCLEATPVLGNCIPFQSSASVFSPVHSAFAIGIAFAS